MPIAPIGRAASVLCGVVALDQLTKHFVASGISEGDSRPLLPGVQLVHVRNQGVAFGALAGVHDLVLVVIAVALGGLVVYFLTHPGRAGLWLPTGLLVGGAVGNVLDRARDGAVTDFIKVPLWPAFNLADSAITLGVLALLYVMEGGVTRPDAS